MDEPAGRAAHRDPAAALARLRAEERTPLAVIGPRFAGDKARVTHLAAIDAAGEGRLLVHGTAYPIADGLRRIRLVARPEDRAEIDKAREAYHAALAALDRAAAQAWEHGAPVTEAQLIAAWAEADAEERP